MGLRPPPALPDDLLDRLGEPEAVFGPNRRFVTASTVVGGGMAVLGVGFIVLGVAARIAGRLPGNELYFYLGLMMMILGVLAVVVPRQAPKWVFVCPRGLARAREDDWDAVLWAEVVRFEDATMSARAVTIRQCRLVLVGGGEWGFLANHVADYGRLSELLRRKMAEREGLVPTPPASGGVG
jgi:hypothetical protein